MTERSFSADIPGAAAWLVDAASRTPYGEVTVTLKLHEGRPPIIERVRTERIKASDGSTVGASNDRRR
jgi:hypothetical protein